MITEYPYFTFRKDGGGRIKDFSLLDGSYAFDGLLTVHKTSKELADYLDLNPDHQIVTASDVFRLGYGELLNGKMSSETLIDYRERYLSNINRASRRYDLDEVNLKLSETEGVELLRYEAIWVVDEPNIYDLAASIDAPVLSLSMVNKALFCIRMKDPSTPPFFFSAYTVTPYRSIYLDASPRSLIVYAMSARGEGEEDTSQKNNDLIESPENKQVCLYLSDFNKSQLSSVKDSAGNSFLTSERVSELNKLILEHERKNKNRRIDLFNLHNDKGLSVFISEKGGPVMTREVDGNIQKLEWEELNQVVRADRNVYLTLIPSGDVTWYIRKIADFTAIADMPEYLSNFIKIRFESGIDESSRLFVTEMINEELYFINSKAPGRLDIKTNQKSLQAGDLSAIDIKIICSAARGAKKIQTGVNP